MKLLRKTCLVAIALFMSTGLLVSCSTDNDTTQNNVSEVNTAGSLKSTTIDEYYLTEVFIGSNTRPSGYMVSETATNNAFYFLDIDGTNFPVTTFDKLTQSVMSFSSPNDFSLYYGNQRYEPIRVINDPGFTPPNPGDQVILRRRYTYGSPTYGPDGCTQGVYYAHYALGVKLSKDKVLYESNGNGGVRQVQVPCGEEYDPTK